MDVKYSGLNWDAIHRWLEDIPVREHTMITKDLQLVISLWLEE